MAVLLASLAVLAACSSESPEVRSDKPSHSTTTASSSAPVSSMVENHRSECPDIPQGSSPATFDDAAGVYAAQSLDVTGDLQLRFDIVQWLGGEDANKAYERESGDSSGAPNDYYIVNDSKQLRTAPVADDAGIYILDNPPDAFTLTLVTFERLGQHLDQDDPYSTYWLTFEHGAITDICQQYRP